MKDFFAKIKSGFGKVKSFKYYQSRKIFFCIPLIVILVMLICGTVYQISDKYDKFANVGVDFQGGTLLNVEMTANQGTAVDMNSANYDYNLRIIDKVITAHGFSIATDQASGESAIIVRYSYVAYGNDPTREAVDYGSNAGDMEELNTIMQDEIKDAFKNDAKYADKDISVNTTASMISNESSIKLLKKALLAVSIALVVMFIYIIIRFNPFSALAAIVALLHDVIIMMSFTVIFRVEIGSTIVAAIITIVAYSINNTIVIFDRLRDELKPLKKGNKRYEVAPLVNGAISATMTRTFYTTLTTLITIVLLAILGVSTIRTFAFPIIFGLIGGFFSSVFIAAPLWGVFTEAWEKHKKKKSMPEAYKSIGNKKSVFKKK